MKEIFVQENEAKQIRIGMRLNLTSNDGKVAGVFQVRSIRPVVPEDNVKETVGNYCVGLEEVQVEEKDIKVQEIKKNDSNTEGADV